MDTAYIYREFYIVDEKNGTIEVRFAETESATTKLRPVVDLSEVTNETRIYVKIEHALEYPYTAYDFEATSFDERYQASPDRYCAAALVATPKLKLL